MKTAFKKWGVLCAITTVALTAYAANVHLVGDASISDDGTTVTVCGKIAGLGNADVKLTLVGEGTTTVACVNPAGKIAPGNATEVLVGATRTIPSTQIKNGSLNFCLTTKAPGCRRARSCGCPNNNWTATITDVDFSSLVLIVEQNGEVVLNSDLL
jgi:hypothetical protein